MDKGCDHCQESEKSRLNGTRGGEGSKAYGTMEVANNFTEQPPLPASEALGSSEHRSLDTDIELARGVSPDNGSIVWDPKPCGCSGDGPKCHECMASSKASVKIKMESWSVEKTVFLGVILGAFFIWAVVFGVCLNIYKL